FDGKIIDTDELHASLDQQLSSISFEVNEVLTKSFSFTPEARVARFEKHARRSIQRCSFEQSRVDRIDVAGIYDPGRANQEFQRNSSERKAVHHKVRWRVDVRPDVRAETEM